jgi:AraC-like DNA-binding protein
MVAHEHHISTRYLFKVWSSQPQTLTETIISTRLEAARRLLATHPRLSVAAAAHRCGFRNVSHFCRRYRAAYHQTPTETQLPLAETAVAHSVRAEHQVRARWAHPGGAEQRSSGVVSITELLATPGGSNPKSTGRNQP